MQLQMTPEVREEIVTAVEGSGCELLELELHGNQLRVILDRSDGVTISDCEQVSKRLSAILDVLEFGDSRYLLEVSSPGLDRKLYGPRDYLRFAGQLARVTWNDPDRGKRTDVGRLQPFEEGQTTIRLLTSGEDRLEVPLDSVLEARLEIED